MFDDHKQEADIIRSKICAGNVTDLVLLDGNKLQFNCCWLKGPKTGLEPDDWGPEPVIETTTDSDNSKSGWIITICVSIFVIFFVIIIIVIIFYCFFGYFVNCFFF